MRKLLIFGNSGSGKSSLAKRLSSEEGLAHLDLDILAWKATVPPERKPLIDSETEISAFTRASNRWVIEGCYADLLQLALPFANEVIFMNLPVALCIENARARPWEPHKYASKDAQDENLEMLIGWISEYPSRDDVCSETAHQALYDQFAGAKQRITRNE